MPLYLALMFFRPVSWICSRVFVVSMGKVPKIVGKRLFKGKEKVIDDIRSGAEAYRTRRLCLKCRRKEKAWRFPLDGPNGNSVKLMLFFGNCNSRDFRVEQHSRLKSWAGIRMCVRFARGCLEIDICVLHCWEFNYTNNRTSWLRIWNETFGQENSGN